MWEKARARRHLDRAGPLALLEGLTASAVRVAAAVHALLSTCTVYTTCVVPCQQGYVELCEIEASRRVYGEGTVSLTNCALDTLLFCARPRALWTVVKYAEPHCTDPRSAGPDLEPETTCHWIGESQPSCLERLRDTAPSSSVPTLSRTVDLSCPAEPKTLSSG